MSLFPYPEPLMLELQNATRGGAEVLLLLTVPGEEQQSITCGINLTSTQTAVPGEPRVLRLVVSGTTLHGLHAGCICMRERSLRGDAPESIPVTPCTTYIIDLAPTDMPPRGV